LSSSVHQSDTLRRLEGALAEVRSRIAAACDRAGRRPEEVRLLGVTKGVTAETVALAGRAGLRDLGENYVQELEAKRDRAPEATWHFVGRLQRNRLRKRFEGLDEVSMGMSADLEAAVEEGATMVRVGTAIFGPRSARRR
jgi:uncharacterized pyridoxal phosphate-containing UPF0001 family protein